MPKEQRADLLGDAWEESDDVAWAVSGDAQAFHVLAARRSEGYAWRDVTALQAEGFATDRWIGNACLVTGTSTLAVVYGPRSFANDEELFGHGAFAALVDLATGGVQSLGAGYTLAYFNPGCGSSGAVALTRLGEARTRIERLNVSSPEDRSAIDLKGQFTSAVPLSDGVAAAASGGVVRLGPDGSIVPMASATGVAYDLAVAAGNDLVFAMHDGETATVYTVGGDATLPREAAMIGRGNLTDVAVLPTGDGTVFTAGLAGTTTRRGGGAAIANLDAARPGDTLSSTGGLAVHSAFSVNGQSSVIDAPGGASAPISIAAADVATERTLDFSVTPGAGQPSRAIEPAQELNTGLEHARGMSLTAEDPHSPVSLGSCAVARNDPSIQAYQPSPAEVEWAVDQAVQGSLGDAQVMFPRPALSGGGRVPAQIMLGILAQESNFWQASRYTVPGVTGNPLVGNYFGGDRESSAADAWWQIDYLHADCGYGIAQVTTGMAAGAMPYAEQLTIATDYRANIARGLQILGEKWDQARDAGVTINNGDPAHLENWFYALWAYNTGFHPPSVAGYPWGVGWSNNPINQIYSPSRGAFLDGSPADAAHPQDWPYPEKVLGFAAHSAYFLASVDQGEMGDVFNYDTAFAPAWWTSSDGQNGSVNRVRVKPPVSVFCNITNECNANNPITHPGGEGPSACQRADFQCWYHLPVTWKSDCSSECGYEYLTYSLGASKPAGPNSYPANCSLSGLPAGALVVDNLPNGTPVARAGCTPVSSAGSFEFSFAAGPDGNYPSRIDVHQLGSGFNGQFYFTHQRVAGTTAAFNGALDVSGTWALGQTLTGWARVLVHMPNHGAWTQQANYAINTGLTTVTRSVNQRNYANTWVSLGTLQFSGTPSISLTNHDAQYAPTAEGVDLANALSGVDDIAWDAVAFVPLAQKPSEFIVAMGDSYSSGEGTSQTNGADFYRGSDHDGIEPASRNACHRSPYAWPYKIDPTDIPGADTVGQLVATADSRIDFQLLACAGAVTTNISPRESGSFAQQYGEATQVDRGFLDSNTTLVTLTIGGNDVGFGPVIQQCIIATVMVTPCAEKVSGDPPAQLGDAVASSISGLSSQVATVLQQIHDKAGNARIVLVGYPRIFGAGASCIFIDDGFNSSWLNSVTEKLNHALTAAASAAGSYVTYENPEYRFSSHEMCATNNGITRLITDSTPGDSPLLTVPLPGSDGRAFVSAQSVHPNKLGTDLYASAANNAMRSTRDPVSADIVGGAGTTYYSTLRWMDGPTSMNVTSFSSCGQEIRIGLRTGASGTQDTETLSWTSVQAMKNFVWNAGSTSTPDLPAGAYAFNARLTTACSGGGTQSWTGELYR